MTECTIHQREKQNTPILLNYAKIWTSVFFAGQVNLSSAVKLLRDSEKTI